MFSNIPVVKPDFVQEDFSGGLFSESVERFKLSLTPTSLFCEKGKLGGRLLLYYGITCATCAACPS
ncbi:MAG: hypothetical protein RRZ63_09930, partial [Clostridium sp.]